MHRHDAILRVHPDRAARFYVGFGVTEEMSSQEVAAKVGTRGHRELTDL